MLYQSLTSATLNHRLIGLCIMNIRWFATFVFTNKKIRIDSVLYTDEIIKIGECGTITEGGFVFLNQNSAIDGSVHKRGKERPMSKVRARQARYIIWDSAVESDGKRRSGRHTRTAHCIHRLRHDTHAHHLTARLCTDIGHSETEVEAGADLRC